MPRNSYSPSRYPGYPPDWDEIRKAVYKRDGYQCANYPNCPDTPDAKILQAHHIIPLSKGGTNNMSNLKTVCRECHKKLHQHMQDSYPGVWDDDDDDDDDYDIDIMPARSSYVVSRHYNATYPASAAARRKSSSNIKWGWIAAAVCVVLGWFALRNVPEVPSTPTSVTVATVNGSPVVFSGPSSKCDKTGVIWASERAVIGGWAISNGETWYRLKAGGWISEQNVASWERQKARRTVRYFNVSDCSKDVGTPTSTVPPKATPIPTKTNFQPTGTREVSPVRPPRR